MLKIFGILMLCVSIIAAGFCLYDKYLSRKKYIEALLKLSETVVVLMQSSNENIFKILNDNANNELLFLKDINQSNMFNKDKVLELLTKYNISKDDRSIVSDFIMGLGTTDIKGQTVHCNFFNGKFRLMLSEAEKNLTDKAKIYRSLSMLLSAAVFIILI